MSAVAVHLGVAFIGVSNTKHIFYNCETKKGWASSLCGIDQRKRDTAYVEFYLPPYRDAQINHISQTHNLCPTCHEKLQELQRMAALES